MKSIVELQRAVTNLEHVRNVNICYGGNTTVCIRTDMLSLMHNEG
jgi:hypothetical protein